VMYHPEIEKLDAIATQLYAKGAKEETTRLQITAGAFQQELLRKSPYKTNRRFLSQQWCWAFGHIGLLQMLIRWFRLHEPETRLVLETNGGCANEYFLKTLEPYISIVQTFPENMADEIMHNAVYFACPDGVRSIHNFYKMVARETTPILELTEAQERDARDFLAQLNCLHPFVAIHARCMSHDPARNITLQMAREAIEPYLAGGYWVVSVGLDEHPIADQFPSVTTLPNPWLASFLLSATCDRFIGSNSGAWTVADAYGRPVELMNDHKHLAWIYPEEVFE
jgi:hypothetical protein